MDCENCDYCEIANCDKISISQFDFLSGHGNRKTKQFDFLDDRNCEDCEIVGFYWQDLEKAILDICYFEGAKYRLNV